MRKIKRTIILFLILLTGFGYSAYQNYTTKVYESEKTEREARELALREEQEINNPLWEEFKKIEKDYKIDLSFTKKVQIKTDWMTFPSGVFCHKPGSLDVLIVGDSTIAWGIVPQVIEQRSGLKVGVFAQRGMYLNKRTVPIVQRLQELYLKPGGMLILGFGFMSQGADPMAIHREDDDFGKVESKSKNEFLQFAKKRYKACQEYINKEPMELSQVDEVFQDSLNKNEENNFQFNLYSNQNFKTYQELVIQRFRNFLDDSFHMKIRSDSGVRELYKSSTHPGWFLEKAKKTGKNPKVDLSSNTIYDLDLSKSPKDIYNIALLRWDPYSTTLFQKYGIFESIPSTEPAYQGWTPYWNLKINGEAVQSLTGKIAYIITYQQTEENYRTSRSIYEYFYKDRFQLIDLGVLHPKEPIQLDKSYHTLNTSGIIKSIQIGDWLKEL
ncbi:MAG: hypothetical protein JJT78_17655 [Leptospira sp.]|nr:hypothetical protein [Leptospira sp.]